MSLGWVRYRKSGRRRRLGTLPGFRTIILIAVALGGVLATAQCAAVCSVVPSQAERWESGGGGGCHDSPWHGNPIPRKAPHGLCLYHVPYLNGSQRGYAVAGSAPLRLDIVIHSGLLIFPTNLGFVPARAGGTSNPLLRI